MRLKLNDYYIGQVRDGQNRYKIEESIKMMDQDHELVIYKDDVITYFYSIPKNKLTSFGYDLLEFFYSDNYDYTDEQLKEFKESYPSIFNNETV